MRHLLALVRDALYAIGRSIPDTRPQSPVRQVPEAHVTHAAHTLMVCRLVAHIEKLRAYAWNVALPQTFLDNSLIDPDNLRALPFEQPGLRVETEYTDDLSHLRLFVRCDDPTVQDLAFQTLVGVFGVGTGPDGYALRASGFECNIPCIPLEAWSATPSSQP